MSSNLVEWVGAGAPVCKEEGQADGLEDAAENTDGDDIKRTLLVGDLGDELEFMSEGWLLKGLKEGKVKSLHQDQQMRKRSKNRGRQRPCS